MKDKMDRPANNKLAADLNDNANQKSAGIDSTRRRLFGAGIAAPIILSMSSRTAWGGAMSAPSGCDSVTFSSHHPDEAAACMATAGFSPAYWRDLTPVDDTDPTDQTVLTDQFFGGTRISTGDFFVTHFISSTPTLDPEALNLASPTLQEVLNDTKPGNILFRHAVAALLNAQAGGITLGGLTPTAAVNQVKEMFNAFLNGDAYKTSTGALLYWNRADDFYTMREYFTNYNDMPFSG